mgnify:FL=1
MIRKFYDMETPDAASGVPEQQQTENAQPSIAELMARHGTKSIGSDEGIPEPISVSKQNSKEAEAEDESPVAPTKGETKAEAEPDKAKEEKESEVPEQIETDSDDIQDWQTTIKNQQPEEVLKALGFDSKVAEFLKELKDVDPKVVGLLNHYKNGGDLKEYLNEMSKDFSSMSAEDVMRHQLRLDYPKATDAQLEVLYKKEIVEKYNLNSYDEDEQNEGKLLLEAKADKYREDLAKMQADKVIPAFDNSKDEQERLAEQKANEEHIKLIVNSFNENPYTKDVLSKNAITIGEGDDKFSFPVDAKEVADIALYGDRSGDLMFEKTKDSNGKEIYVPKSQHQLLVATVNKYGEKFITELAKHYKSLGSKAAIAPIENARPAENRNASSASPEPTTLAGAMAKYGKMNSGGW